MIQLDSAEVLLNALKRLNFPAQNITPNSANAHILFDQEESTLKLTAYGEDGSWLRQVIPSPSTQDGARYLVLGSDVPRIQNAIKPNYGLIIDSTEGELEFSTIDGYRDGKPNVLDKILIQQYHGAMEDFGPPVFYQIEDEYPTVVFDESQLVSVLDLIFGFAEFGKSKELRGFYVVVKDGLAEFYTNSFEPNYFLKVVIPCTVLISQPEGEDFDFVLRGEHIKMIVAALKAEQKKKKLEDGSNSTATVILRREEGLTDMITIHGSVGSVTAPGLEVDRMYMLTSAPSNFESSEYFKEISYRTFEIKRMKEALEAQQPTKDAQGKRIKIHAEGLDLFVSKLSDYALKEKSRVPTDDEFVVANEVNAPDEEKFPTLAYSAGGLLQVMSTLEKIKAKHSIKGAAQLRTVRNTKNGLWAVVCSLVEPTAWGQYEIMAAVSEPRPGDLA